MKKHILKVVLSIVFIGVIVSFICIKSNKINIKNNNINQTQDTINSNLSQEINKFDYEENTIMSFLTDTYNKPIILYNIGNSDISKDAKILDFYVLKDGKCKKYAYNKYTYGDIYKYAEDPRINVTLGELSKMTDEEIIEMLEEDYKTNYAEVLQKWKEGVADKLENADVYIPRYFDITSYLFTDSTGNRAIGEVIYLPKSGIKDNPYIFSYNNNWYGYYFRDSDSTQLTQIYFNLGYATKDDIQKVSDIYCLTPNNVTTGNVYQSIYYGWKASESTWSKAIGTLIFRDENAYAKNLILDSLDSDLIDYIDPTEDDIKEILHNNAFSYEHLKMRVLSYEY